MQILKEKIVRYETDGSIVKGYDAGELIRCKDCKHWSKPPGWNGWCCEHDIPAEADDFCSKAERKEE